MYSFEELESAFDKFDKEAIQRFLENIQSRSLKGEYVKTYEAEFFCQSLKLFQNKDGTKVELNIEEKSLCEDYVFDLTYLRYWHDLHGIKKHFDYDGYEVPKNKIVKDLEYLGSIFFQWKKIIEKERHKNELLEALTIETRKNHLKPLRKNKRFFIDGIFYSNHEYKHKEKQIVLHSRFIYYRVKLLFEKKGVKYLEYKLWDKELILDKKAIIHILFCHYSAAIKDYQIDKSYHRDIEPNRILELIKNVIKKISENTLVPTNFPEKIYFGNNGKLYALWFPKPKGINSKLRITTFYPVEKRYELERIKNSYEERRIDESLLLYMLKA